ncbi:MAG TPA: hypothetical protein VI775_02550 [Candidatus Paceibacterota bacterium]
MNEESQKKHRIGGFAIVLLLLLSITADFISVIPFIGDIFWAFMAFYLWRTGHGLLNMRRLIPAMTSIVIEMLPFLSALPSIVAGTMIIIGFSRIEEKTGISLAPKSAMRAPNARIPFYNNGKRLPRKENMVELEQ